MTPTRLTPTKYPSSSSGYWYITKRKSRRSINGSSRRTPRCSGASCLLKSRSPIPVLQLASHVSPAVRAVFPHNNLDEERDAQRNPVGLSRRGTSHLKNPTQPVIYLSSAITRTDLIASAE
ncbi:uncharacterized protein MELLADRAFT_110270 [Melampsora larici-populina 98AG31]|uniref:Uncharacterized protein n=1 Tax=Melampsora larici-populina (strain 98AG31 / pathotype 3-4-7) TaxID=747676 RepID=F4RZ80_MELLP|nr:uncharacterized protein MELLADRAFT_110270 [Melampsora larici-populina 98AG31]EGG02177.1 hypothetical protein MELLADRAFT_110270 [Melampsora larici-populina 98AG31]